MTAKIRVANVIEEGKLGGPQIRIYSVAEALADEVNTLVVMPKQNSELFQLQCRNRGVKFAVLPLNRITKEISVAIRYILFFPFEVFLLATLLKRSGCALVHVSGGAWQYKGILAGWLARKKVVWHLNDTTMPKLFRALFKLFCPLADTLIYASERSRDYYGTLVPAGKPSFIVPAPVDTAHYDPARDYGQDMAETFDWKDKTIVATVANINPVKGLDMLIRTAAQVKALRPDILFLVIGPVHKNQSQLAADLKAMCLQLGADNVLFIGGRSDTRALLQRADIYICSSYAESSPLAVWEAMGMAKPVVSTDVGDVPLYVTLGQSGVIVPVGDDEAMAHAVCSLADDPDRRSQYGTAARRVAQEKLDLSACARRHLEAYKGTLES